MGIIPCLAYGWFFARSEHYLQIIKQEGRKMTDRVASTVSYAGAGAAVLGGLSLNEWFALGGFIVAVITFAYNVWYKERMLKELRQKSQITIKED